MHFADDVILFWSNFFFLMTIWTYCKHFKNSCVEVHETFHGFNEKAQNPGKCIHFRRIIVFADFADGCYRKKCVSLEEIFAYEAF